MNTESPSTPIACDLLLVSDRSPERTDELRAHLETTGFAVATAASADEGLRLAAEGEFALLLLDLADTPAELCSTLRAQDGTRTTPIVVLVEGDDSEQLEAARAAGATDFLERSAAGEALLEHRLRSTLRYVDALVRLDELGGQEHARSRAAVSDGAAFHGRIGSAIDQARDSDRRVALLELLFDDHGEGQPNLLNRLRAAVDDMDDCGVPAHMRGELRPVRLEDGRQVLLVTDLARLQDALKLARWAQATLTDSTRPVGPAVGIATSPENGTEPSRLLELSRAAAKSARDQGGNRVSFHDPAMNRWALERITLEGSLRSAVERGQLVVYYQPKLELATGRVTGLEALVRWNHPELGMVSPGQFIPLAEETGLIVPIGEWVLGTAARQNKAWQEAGFAPVRMAVNLSPVQFRQPGLVEIVGRVLRETGLSPEWLELELTESMLMDDVRKTTATLRRLKESGLQLSIDDFGTGYSSLSYLKRFPIDALKIDQSFIREVTTNADDAAIATSILLMGHSLKLKVIAEGVETESQRSFLEVLQCDEIQGFLLSPPVPAEEAQQFLTR